MVWEPYSLDFSPEEMIIYLKEYHESRSGCINYGLLELFGGIAIILAVAYWIIYALVLYHQLTMRSITIFIALFYLRCMIVSNHFSPIYDNKIVNIKNGDQIN